MCGSDARSGIRRKLCVSGFRGGLKKNVKTARILFDFVRDTKYVDDMRRKKMGRPPIPKNERKSVRLSFRMTAALHRAVSRAAKQQGKSVGGYINDIVENAVKGGE